MEKLGGLDFKVGQQVEMRTFLRGYRGAWFRCKIKDIVLEKNKILPEYYDFEPEGLKWEKIYQVPPYGIRSNHIKRQLMVRPEYPVVYHKSEMPPANSITQACLVIDGIWKVGDLVDWCEGDCFWSARIVKILSNDKVQIEWPMPPSGEWKKGENERQEVFCKDLRPFLDWSETEGWTLPTVEGQAACDAQLIFPTKQDESSESILNLCVRKRKAVDEEVENRDLSITNEHTLEVAIDEEVEKRDLNIMHEDTLEAVIDEEVENRDLSITHEHALEAAIDEEVEKRDLNITHEDTLEAVIDEEVEKRGLNIMHEHTLEAAILGLEELVNKVKWLQRILQSPRNDATTSWKFA